MQDLISRQAAIEALDGVKVDEGYCTEYEIGYNDGIDFAVSSLSVLPAAQPVDKDIDVPSTDCISRQAVLDMLDEIEGEVMDGEGYKYGKWSEYVEQLPATQPQYKLDEFCTDCKEYDKERHCCPRWNRVIRQTLAEAQHQRTMGYERVVYCGECVHMMPDGRCREFADDNIRPSASDYCSAGEKRADMKEEQDGENM